MSRGDKYSKANALSKIFEELLMRHKGDKKATKEDMDEKLGKAWQVEIVIDDEIGPEFIDPELLDGLNPEDIDVEERDEMFKKARKFSEDFVRPSGDLEYDMKDGPAPKKDKDGISCMLRKLADMLEGK